MTTVKIKSKTNYSNYFELALEIVVSIPLTLNSLANKKEIAEAYRKEYDIEKVEGDDLYFSKIQTFNATATMLEIEATIDAVATTYTNTLAAFTPTAIDDIIGKTRKDGLWVYIAEPV